MYVDVDLDVNGIANDDLDDMVMILMVLLMMLITQPLNVRMAKSSVSSEALVRVELEQGLHLVVTVMMVAMRMRLRLITVMRVVTIVGVLQFSRVMVVWLIGFGCYNVHHMGHMGQLQGFVIAYDDCNGGDSDDSCYDVHQVGSFRGGGLEEVLEWAASHGARLVIISISR